MGLRAFYALVALVAITAAADEAAVEKPALKVEESWKYRVTRESTRVTPPPPFVYEIKVTFVGPKGVKVVNTQPDGTEIDTTWTPEWNVVTDSSSGSFYPDSGLLKFPLKPGLRYRARFEVVRPRRNTFDSKNDLTVRVVGWEDVTVPAGTFRALKVEATGTYNRVDKDKHTSGKQHYVAWYVPAIKRWAKFHFDNTGRRGGPGEDRTEELVSYRVH